MVKSILEQMILLNYLNYFIEKGTEIHPNRH